MMGSLSGCMVLLGFVGRYFYAKYALRFKHRHKLSAVLAVWFLGLLLLYSAKKTNQFLLVLVGCLFLGLGTSIGGLVIVGFIKCFPPIIFSGYSAGTGGAGLFGAACYMLLKLFDAQFEFVLVFMAMAYPVYFFAFQSLLKSRFEAETIVKDDTLIDDGTEVESDPSTVISKESSERPMVGSFEEEGATQQVVFTEDLSDFELKEARINEILTLPNTLTVVSMQRQAYFLFFAMYLLEYFSITELADRLSSQYQSQDPKHKMVFAPMQLVYQFGVFVGRSTLDYLQIKSTKSIIWGLLLLVGAFWLQLVTRFCWSEMSLYVGFLLIGVLGGLGYCNIMFQVLSDSKLEKKWKVE